MTARTAFTRAVWILAAAVSAAAAPAAAQSIRIGEITSYSRLPAFTEPYRNGWQLAVEEINNAGGVLGRPLEVISRDASGSPEAALQAAEDLVRKQGAVMLAGTFLSYIGLAVADYAGENKVPFIAAQPLVDALTGTKGNRYTFRLRPSTSMQAAILAEEAARLGLQRWATVAPDDVLGRERVVAFKAALTRRQPDVEFVAERWTRLGLIDAAAETVALIEAKPDALFSAVFGGDLLKLLVEGRQRGLFDGLAVVSPLAGEPEILDPLRDDAPEGWIVTGYPWYGIDTPEHRRFVNAYRAKFNDYPRLGSLLGYNTFKAIAAIIEAAGSTEADKLVAAAESVRIESPTGPFAFRPVDHQATLGSYVGRIARQDGKGIMVDWRYADGADYLPGEEKAGGQ